MASRSASSGILRTSYTSNPVDLPDSFLKGPPAKPITFTPVPFATSQVKEFAGRTAFMLDNVLSLEECNQLIALAEESSPVQPGESPWKPALVSLGPGLEAAAPDYRNSDRIIWDRQDVVDRLWERCIQAEGVEKTLANVPNSKFIKRGRWQFRCLNERMRFLKYTPGMFFKPHCDGAYCTSIGGKTVETHYTLHLYLNDEGLVGGATGFLSFDRKRRYDVNPKAGSVLIFQHDHLFHEGAPVQEGVKYTMRTDIMYQWEEGRK
ncbi:hypothetical protein PT974_05571 [Cladobotryum mycophilum]|uniref:Prolyl 4-hydroxylase alpha subunit domain-containing protein n=1 Tax=Cladobotryum mycophilum TaxID=491253 RepID=A0ABR0SJ27_9HYPO